VARRKAARVGQKKSFWKTPWGIATIGGGAFVFYELFMKSSPPAPLNQSDLPPTVNLITARPVPVTPGTVYYGVASVSWPLSALVSASKIVSKLTSMGFSNISVMTSSSQLPVSWPANARTGDYFVTATYAGSAPTTISVPGQVSAVWTMA
jgi:hypothetical protein